MELPLTQCRPQAKKYNRTLVLFYRRIVLLNGGNIYQQASAITVSPQTTTVGGWRVTSNSAEDRQTPKRSLISAAAAAR